MAITANIATLPYGVWTFYPSFRLPVIPAEAGIWCLCCPFRPN